MWTAVSQTKEVFTSKYVSVYTVPPTSMKVSSQSYNYFAVTPNFQTGLLCTTGTTTLQFAFLSQTSCPLLQTLEHPLASWLHIQPSAMP